MSDIVISGYYGFRNSGDDALLMSIIKELKEKQPDIDIVVLSKNPKETREIYNVRAVARENVFGMIYEIMKAKMLISGGGTLMQDSTSTKSLLYYLSIINIALAFNKKVMLYANGIGPLRVKKNRERVRKTLEKVDVITLRDSDALNELEKTGVSTPYIEVTADPAFNLNITDDKTAPVFKELESDKKYMLVSVREWSGAGKNLTAAVAQTCDYAFERYGLTTVFLPMQLQKDLKITQEIRSCMKNNSVLIDERYTIDEQLSVIKNMHICIGMRLHTLIYAAAMCVPHIGIVYDPKINGFLDYIGSDSYCNASDITEDKLISELDACMSNYEQIKDKLLSDKQRLGEKADRNAELATELLKRRKK